MYALPNGGAIVKWRCYRKCGGYCEFGIRNMAFLVSAVHRQWRRSVNGGAIVNGGLL